MTPAPAEGALRWRPAAFVLLAGAVVLFGLAVVVRSPVPVLFAFPLLLAPLAAALFGPRASPRVRVEGTVEGSDRSVSATAVLTPEPPVEPDALDAVFPVPPEMAEVRPPIREVVGSGLRIRLEWRLADPTLVTVPPPEVIWRDPLGLVERVATLEYAPMYIERYPPELHRAGAIRLRRTLALPGETRSRAVGESGEFYGIREAAPDEPPRRINWRASARLGRRLANEYVLDRTGDLVILLDARPTPLGPALDGRLLAVARSAAFGLAEAFLREKSRVGVAAYSEFLDAVPLASGRTQRLRIRSLLLRTGVGGTSGPSERGAVALRRYFRSRTTTVVLSPLVTEEQLELVAHVRRRGYPVVVLSPSYLPLSVPRATLGPEDEGLAARYALLVRREAVRRTWREAPVVDWEEFWSLGGFVQFLRRPATRGNAV